MIDHKQIASKLSIEELKIYHLEYKKRLRELLKDNVKDYNKAYYIKRTLKKPDKNKDKIKRTLNKSKRTQTDIKRTLKPKVELNKEEELNIFK